MICLWGQASIIGCVSIHGLHMSDSVCVCKGGLSWDSWSNLIRISTPPPAVHFAQTKFNALNFIPQMFISFIFVKFSPLHYIFTDVQYFLAMLFTNQLVSRSLGGQSFKLAKLRGLQPCFLRLCCSPGMTLVRLKLFEIKHLKLHFRLIRHVQWVWHPCQLGTRKDGEDVDDREHLLLQGQGGADLPCWAPHHDLREDDIVRW